VDGTREQIHDTLDLDGTEALAISAKHGDRRAGSAGSDRRAHSAARGRSRGPLKALVFDSFYDSYQGVVIYVRVRDGRVRPGTKILLMSNGRAYDVAQVGVFSPDMRPVDELSAGQVGYITAAIKRVADAKIGDTITEAARPTAEPFPGYRDAKPMVFAGLSRSRTPSTKASGTRWRSCASTTPAFNFEPETSMPSATGSAAAFSACSTWRSCRSASSASSTSR